MVGNDGASECSSSYCLEDRLIALRSALSPTAPFPVHAPRLRLAAPLAPLILITYFVHAAFFLRTFTFVLGIAFFGQPLITKAARWLTQKVPDWRQYLELRRYV